jgi:DNA helicase HerA-like ATPase
MTVCGQIVAGEVGKILIREKSGEKIELGDLLVVDDPAGYTILQVYDLLYGSQISQLAREQIAGLKLEGFGVGLEFFEPQLRNYLLAEAKAVLRMTDRPQSAKVLPDFFGTVRHVEQKDLPFLSKPEDPIYLGKVRSGSKIIDVPVYLQGQEALTHHILIPSATGRGKSNLVKVMLWSIIGQGKFGILVLDAHDEYYGRNGKGLKDHNKSRDHVLYYSVNPITGTSTLLINLRTIQPDHLNGRNEMATERHALIDSAAQDLTDDDCMIASLDKGEAIVTSIFQKFAVPIQIPLFDELVKEQKAPAEHPSLQYSG